MEKLIISNIPAEAIGAIRNFILESLPEMKDCIEMNTELDIKVVDDFEIKTETQLAVNAPAKTPVEVRTIVLKNLSSEIVEECQRMIIQSQNDERTAPILTEKQFHISALGQFQSMLLRQAQNINRKMVFAINK